MADEITRLVIEVDSSQVKAATETLKVLGFAAETAGVAAGKISAINVDASKIRSAAASLNELGIKAKVVEASANSLARATTEVGKAISNVSTGSDAFRNVTKSADEATNSVQRLFAAMRSVPPAPNPSSFNNQLGSRPISNGGFNNQLGGGGRLPPPPIPPAPAPPVPPQPPGPPQQPGLRGAINQAYQQNAAGQTALNQRLVQGAQANGAFAQSANATTTAMGKQAGAAQNAANALTSHMKSARRVAFENQQLEYQIHDFVVQVLGGQSPFLALVQQGSQLAGTFGGIRGAISAVLGLITPTVIAIGTLAAALIGVGLAAHHVESVSRAFATLQAQLEGTGRAGAFTSDQLKRLVEDVAKNPGISRDDAFGIIGEFTKAGDISTQFFGRLGSLTADYAKATGQTLPQAAKELAQSFAEPTKGVETLQKALHQLDPNEMAKVRDAMDIGDKVRADTILLAELERTIKGLNGRSFTELQHSTDELSKAWSNLTKSFEESTGLKTVLHLMAELVNLMTWLIQNGDKIKITPTMAFTGLAIPGAAPAVISKGLGDLAKEGIDKVFGTNLSGSNPAKPAGSREAVGKVTNTAGAAVVGNAGAVVKTTGDQANKVNDVINRAINSTEKYDGIAKQIDTLQKKRGLVVEALKAATDKYGKNAPVVEDLRGRLAGVDEKIAALRRRGLRNGKDQERIDDAKMKDQIDAVKDALAIQENAFKMQEKILQTDYSLGETSFKAYFDRRIEIIREAADAEVRALDDQIKAVEERLGKTKDPVKKEQLQDQLKNLQREKPKVAQKRQNEEAVLTDENRVAYLHLTEQVESYRQELLHLQGDEEGAAKIRDEATKRRATILAGQTEGDAKLDTSGTIQKLDEQLTQQRELNRLKREQNFFDQSRALAEENINRLAENGTISEVTAMQRLGDARRAVLPTLEEIAQKLEAIAAKNPLNLELRLDAQRARAEVDKLKDSLDPLAEKFNSMFRDQAANAITDLFSGKFRDSTKQQQQDLQNLENQYLKMRDQIKNDPALSPSARDRQLVGLNKQYAQAQKDAAKGAVNGIGGQVLEAIKQFSGGIVKEVNGVIAKELSQQLFGKDGALGGALSKLFNGKNPLDKKSPIDEAGASLQNMQNVGIDPATAALQRFTQALDNASSVDRGPESVGALDNAATSVDRGPESAPLGETASNVSDSLENTSKVADRANTANLRAASSVLTLANSAAHGSSSLLSFIQSLSSLGGFKNPGGLIGSAIGGLTDFFGGGASDIAFGSTSFADAFAGGLIPLASGGYTGNMATNQAAGIVHGKEFVFSAAATAAIGRGALEKAHEAAKAGDRNALVSVLTKNLNTGKQAPGYMSGGYVEDDHPNNLPGYMDGGYVEDWPRTLRNMNTAPIRAARRPAETADAATKQGSGDTHVHVSVTPPAGGSRATAMQWGTEAGRQIQNSLRRNGKS